jgi:hypothetical protein
MCNVKWVTLLGEAYNESVEKVLLKVLPFTGVADF